MSTRSRAAATAIACAALSAVVGCSGSLPDAPPAPPSSATAAVDPRAGARIDAALEDLFEASSTDSYRDVRAVLVLAGDELILENYYDSGAEESANVFSVTKTVISLLVGIALDQGHLDSLDQPLPDLLPEHAGTRRRGLQPSPVGAEPAPYGRASIADLVQSVIIPAINSQ